MSDYKPCGVCGFDHEYDSAYAGRVIKAAHRPCEICHVSIDIVTTFCGEPVCRDCAETIPEIEAVYAEIEAADAAATVTQ